MTNTYPNPTGFPMWEERFNDPSIILSAALTSANDLGGGVVGGATASTVTYSDAGILLGSAGTASVNFVNHAAITSAMKTNLLGGCTFTCWVETGWLMQTYLSIGEHLMGAKGSNYWTAVKGGSSGHLQGRSAGHLSAAAQMSNNCGKGTHCRVDMTYKGNGTTVLYVDYLPVTVLAYGPADADPFSSFVGVGGSASGDGPVSYRIKNFMLTSRSISTVVRHRQSHFAIFGHSFTTHGDYASVNTYITGDSLYSVPGANEGDRNTTLQTIHRSLAARGITIPEGKIRNYGVSGSVVADMAGQITTATAGGKRLKVIFIESGTNEVTSSGAVSFATSYPTWQATWQTQINSLVAAGASMILIGNVASTVSSVTLGWNGAIYQQRCNDANVIIDALIAANPTTCYKVDLFTLFGGHNITAADWNPDNVHPSDIGLNKIGTAFANKLISLL